MKNKTLLYLFSALLWLGVAFFSFFIYQNSEEQEVETIVQSSKKIDNLYQNFCDIEEKWWERTKLANFTTIDSRDLETYNHLQNSKQSITTFKNSDKLTFAEIEKQLPKLGKYNNGRSYASWIEDFIANEDDYLSSKLTNELYKSDLIRTFRREWQQERNNKIYEGCVMFVDSQIRLDEFEKSKIALSIIGVFNNYTIGYFSFPKNVNEGIFIDKTKSFEFEMAVKTLGRNPKTTTKRYKTLPKEGQELKPFDYEEIK